MQENEERLRLATQAARVAVWEYDFIEGRMTRTENHDALYGLPPQEVWTYDVFIKATHPDDREAADRCVQASVKPGGPDDYACDFRVVWPDGSIHWLAVTGHVATRDSAGTATMVRGALIDVTRLKEVEADLRSAVRARDEFLQIAGHELKTPLTPLSLKLAMLLKKARAAEAAEAQEVPPLGADLEAAQRQVTRLTELVNGLLDVSRISQSRLELEISDVDMERLVREVAEQFSLQAERANCPVQLEVERGLVGRWDKRRLEQVLSNLFTNALKYGANGPVRVRAERVGARARLSVKDMGIGIAPEFLSRIFGKFERAVSNRHYGGMGLGLFIAREIVEAMGGTLTVQSELGKGSTFTVDLPLGG